jgi:hypothetical protein
VAKEFITPVPYNNSRLRRCRQLCCEVVLERPHNHLAAVRGVGKIDQEHDAPGAGQDERIAGERDGSALGGVLHANGQVWSMLCGHDAYDGLVKL